MDSNRRKFIKNSGLISGAALLMAQIPPVEKLVAAILQESIQKAGADDQYIDSKYISVALMAAPPRWAWDQVFASIPGESVPTNAMIMSNFVNGGGSYSTAEYRTFNYKGTMVPTLWSTNVPTASGGLRPMSDLLDNMLMFRGFGSGTDGHPSNAARQTCPLPGAGSIDGWVADYSSTLFKAAAFPNLGGYYGYASMKGTAQTMVNDIGMSNYAATMMGPFADRSDAANLARLRNSYAGLVSDAQGVLSTIAAKDSRNYAAVDKDQQQALQKIKAGISNLVDVWPSLFNKYNNLILAALRDRSSPGFNDLPILPGADDGVSVEGPWTIQPPSGSNIVLQPGVDIRGITSNLDATSMASAFALCEFLMTNNLVSSYQLGVNYLNGLSGMSVREVGTASHAPKPFTTQLYHDQHVTGALVGLYINSCLYRALSACLLELISVLKANSLFNKTAIHINSDFTRVPRVTGGGADHNYDGMIASVLTGLNTSGPKVIGNILSQGTNGQYSAAVYTGCSGHKAPTNVSGKSLILSPSHVTSSLAVMMNLPINAWFNSAPPLVSVSGGVVTSVAEGKVVAS